MTDWNGKGLVSTEWLAANRSDPNLRVFDSTVHLVPATPGPYTIQSGRADYETAHVPGAAFIDLFRDLSDTDAPLPFTKPSDEKLAKALGAVGIEEGNHVVVYSTTTPMWATRVWWMLRASGFANVSVLDGGFAKWAAEKRPVETQENKYSPTDLEIRPRSNAWANKQAVLSAIDDSAICTINALSPGVFSGTSSTSYGRKGHITGSVNVPYASMLNEDGTYRSEAELRSHFAASGALKQPHVICYCGGGISATMDALALTLLGHRSVAVYDGSMSEWCQDNELPMETSA